MKMTAAERKKERLMVAVVGLWMSLKHFINHSCTHTKLTETVCVCDPKRCLAAESHGSAAVGMVLIPAGRWLRP